MRGFDTVAFAKAAQARLQELWIKKLELTADERAEFAALEKLYLPCIK